MASAGLDLFAIDSGPAAVIRGLYGTFLGVAHDGPRHQTFPLRGRTATGNSPLITRDQRGYRFHSLSHTLRRPSIPCILTSADPRR